jgi:hypothetical protein
VERAPVAVIQEAWINDVLTRKINEMVWAGMDGHLEVIRIDALILLAAPWHGL